MPDLGREGLRTLTEDELRAFAAARPRSKALAERAQGALVGGVPMPWMMRRAGAFAVFCAAAEGARVTDVDEAVADGRGGTRSRAGNVGPAVDPASTTTAIE